MKAQLEDIVDAMDFTNEEYQSYLNLQTGKVIYLSRNDISEAEKIDTVEGLPTWKRDNIEGALEYIANEDDYLKIPLMNDYQMIEDFCYTVADRNVQQALFNVIIGKGAFRRFKNALNQYNISDQWYNYRNQQIRNAAIEWCERHQVQW